MARAIALLGIVLYYIILYYGSYKLRVKRLNRRYKSVHFFHATIVVVFRLYSAHILLKFILVIE